MIIFGQICECHWMNSEMREGIPCSFENWKIDCPSDAEEILTVVKTFLYKRLSIQLRCHVSFITIKTTPNTLKIRFLFFNLRHYSFNRVLVCCKRSIGIDEQDAKGCAICNTLSIRLFYSGHCCKSPCFSCVDLAINVHTLNNSRLYFDFLGILFWSSSTNKI